MRRKKITVTVLVVLVLSTTFVFLNQTFAQSTSLEKQKAEDLLSILENTNMSIVSGFDELDKKNLTANNAQETYQQGLIDFDEAISLMTQENFEDACTKAVEAMQEFEQTLMLIESVSPSDSTPTTSESAIILRTNINRAVSYLEKLKTMATQAAAAGYNTSAVEKRLAEIEQYLLNATQKLGALNLEEATKCLTTAETLLDELMEYVDRLTNVVSESNAQRYLQVAKDRVTAAKVSVSVSATLTAEAKEAALSALSKSETNLANAEDLIEANKVDDAIEELEEAKRWEETSNTASLSATSVAPSSSTQAESLTDAQVKSLN